MALATPADVQLGDELAWDSDRLAIVDDCHRFLIHCQDVSCELLAAGARRSDPDASAWGQVQRLLGKRDRSRHQENERGE
jgi:hypothetical protein